MIDLLYKDFKLMFGTNKNISARLAKLFVSLIFIGSFVTIEVFLFTSILNKIKSYNNAPYAFINLFLFVISILLMISGVVSAYKLFFNEKDIEQLSVHPIPNSAIISSKLVFLFILHYATCFLFCYPLFIAYAIMIGKGSWFYYLALFYPVFSFFLEMGISLLFVYPYFLIKKFLKKHLVLKFGTSLVGLFLISFVYSKVLNLFVNLIAGGNTNQLVSYSFITKLQSIERFEIPLKYLVDCFINRHFTSIIPYVLISLGIFIIGAALAIFAFNYVRNIAIASVVKKNDKPLEVHSVKHALISKELILLTRNADYTSSFTGLLVLQPFLAYLVIKALNTIFTNGTFAYYITLVPNFLVIIDILLVMFFTVMIAQGASLYISMEKKTIKVMKVIPVPYPKQMFYKVIIPFTMSVASLLVTLLVLLIGKVISLPTMLFSLLMCILLLLIFTLVSVKEELSIGHKKPRNTFFSNLVSYLVPVVFAGVAMFLNFKGVSLVICYLVTFGIFVAIIIPIFLYLRAKLNSLFLDLDMVN